MKMVKSKALKKQSMARTKGDPTRPLTMTKQFWSLKGKSRKRKKKDMSRTVKMQ
jgi:hypothetical protein